MSKTAVIYWSGTGNTEAMAREIAEGLRQSGLTDVELYTVDKVDGSKINQYDRLAFGCPSMGAEVLEEGEFEPFFTSVESQLKGKKVILFGSYGWGDGEWMRDWYERTAQTGAMVFDEGLMLHETPDAAGLEQCRNLGKEFAAY